LPGRLSDTGRRRKTNPEGWQAARIGALMARCQETRSLGAEYFQRFPKERYQTEVESWRELQSQNIEFTMKRLREPVEGGG